ncbi:hypothetical protein [Escherichia coli]|uniref:hypothetical protein n=1 Tax=Escherichia coli TaxID=562 RepID=UPI0035B6666C
MSVSFVPRSTPTETDGAAFSGTYHATTPALGPIAAMSGVGHGPAVADEYDQPTSAITKDKCSKCLSGCKFRNNVGNLWRFLPQQQTSR